MTWGKHWAVIIACRSILIKVNASKVATLVTQLFPTHAHLILQPVDYESDTCKAKSMISERPLFGGRRGTPDGLLISTVPLT